MKIKLLIILLFITYISNAQNYFDVWKASQSMLRSKQKDTNSLFRQRPSQFNATDKEGHLITYYKINNNTLIKTRSGKKVKTKESIFYTTKIDNLSILSITNDTINGFIQDKEKIINMSNNEVSESPNIFFNTNLDDEAILSPSMLKKDKSFRNPKNKNKAESSPLPRVFTDTAGTTMLPKTVNSKFTCDYKLYQSWGNNSSNLANFVSGFFIGVQELYRREGIPLNLRSIYIYDIPDPWTNYTNQSLCLNDFATANPTTDTCMNMLLTSKPWGGLAYVNMLDGMYANSVSGIYNTFAPLPTYSWTIGVVTHEWGHTIGAKHTHWCGWRLRAGVYGRIDSCYAGEAYNGVSCGTTIKYPSGGGTIMSYCHLNYQVGINFNKGFGPLVRYKMRKSIMDSRIKWNNTPVIVPCTTNYLVSSICWNNTWKTRNYTQTGNNCTTPPIDSLIRNCPVYTPTVSVYMKSDNRWYINFNTDKTTSIATTVSRFTNTSCTIIAATGSRSSPSVIKVGNNEYLMNPQPIPGSAGTFCYRANVKQSGVTYLSNNFTVIQ